MLYKSLNSEQSNALYKQHSEDCLERYEADQLSAPALDHRAANLAYARLYALIAEDPTTQCINDFMVRMDNKPITDTDRDEIIKLVEGHSAGGGPFNHNYLAAALSAQGIEPTQTNQRKTLPIIALARSHACLELNKKTYNRDAELGWELPAPLNKVADTSTAPAGSGDQEPSSGGPLRPILADETTGAMSGCLSENEFIDGPISEVRDAVIEAKLGNKTWSKAIAGDVKRAMAFLIAGAGDIPFSQLRQHHAAVVSAMFPRLHRQYRYLKQYRERGIDGALEAGDALIAEGKKAEVGLAPATVNKHLTWISKSFVVADALGYRPPMLKFSGFRFKGKKLNTRKHNERRPRWDIEEFKKLQTGPIFEGCAGLFRRFEPGGHVFHDGAYFGIPMLINTAGRSAEAAGASTAEIVLDGPIPYLLITENHMRGLKTVSSTRRLPILPKLMELGFGDYVRQLQTTGQTAIFP